MEKRLDAAGLTAITSLMNKSKVNMTMDLKKAENEIMGISSTRKKEANVIDEYDKKINSFARSIGISIGKSKLDVVSMSDSEGDGDSDGESDGESNSISESADESGEESGSAYSQSTGSIYSSASSVSGSVRSASSRSASLRSASSRSASSRSASSRSSVTSVASSTGRHMDRLDKITKHRDERHSRTSQHNYEDRREKPRRDNYLTDRLNSLHSEQPIAASTDRLKQIELKTVKIEKIQQLYGILTDAGIDCGKLVIPSVDSSMQEIDLTLSSLQLKNDRNRYSTMAEEVLLTAAASVERLFDGTREIPLLGIRPDYTNYSATLNVKLHSLRYHTAQAVGEMIEKHSFGHKTRIMMELLPGFFLYPIQQAKNSKDPGLTAEHLGAINNIRKSNSTGAPAPSLRDLTDI